MRVWFIGLFGFFFLCVAQARASIAERLEVLGYDKDPDDFERVTVHFRLHSQDKQTNFDVLVYAKNPISIVQSTDHSMIGINACDATKSNDITLVYLKKHRVIVAPHANDWLDVGQGYGWFYILGVKNDEVAFDVHQDNGSSATALVKVQSVFK